MLKHSILYIFTILLVYEINFITDETIIVIAGVYKKWQKKLFKRNLNNKLQYIFYTIKVDICESLWKIRYIPIYCINLN